jgi:hypothetical protein
MKFWLVVTLMYPGQQARWATGAFPTLDQCLRALEAAELVIPKPLGKDGKTWAGFKACVPEPKSGR